jgi:hypothetical protein
MNRKKPSRGRLACVLVVSAAGLSAFAWGCATGTTVTNVWSAAQREPVAPVRNVLVMGARMDETSRRQLEDGFSQALALHGVRATPSYVLFPNGFPSTDEAKNAVRSVGYDGLLVAESKGTTERTTVVPGYGYGFWGDYYWGPAWAGWYPGYVYTDEFVKYETTLWDPKGAGRLVWAANTQTENPSSGKDFLKSLLGKVMPEMEKAGVIPPKGAAEQLSELR